MINQWVVNSLCIPSVQWEMPKYRFMCAALHLTLVWGFIACTLHQSVAVLVHSF